MLFWKLHAEKVDYVDLILYEYIEDDRRALAGGRLMDTAWEYEHVYSPYRQKHTKYTKDSTQKRQNRKTINQ